MKLTRRQFAILTAAVAAGCGRAKVRAAATAPTSQPSKPSGPVDAGPINEFKTDDVYDAFRDQGFFIVRREEKLFALSSICTHKGCKVRVQDDLSFLCKCHGSRFNKDGHVKTGPAKRDLPRLAVAMDDQKHLVVDPSRPLAMPSSKPATAAPGEGGAS